MVQQFNLQKMIHKTMGVELKVQWAKWSENDLWITFGSPPSNPPPFMLLGSKMIQMIFAFFYYLGSHLAFYKSSRMQLCKSRPMGIPPCSEVCERRRFVKGEARPSDSRGEPTWGATRGK